MASLDESAQALANIFNSSGSVKKTFDYTNDSGDYIKITVTKKVGVAKMESSVFPAGDPCHCCNGTGRQ
jgi:hypothetical protein